MLQALFGITEPAAIKEWWAALTLCNAGLMLGLAFRGWPRPFAHYMLWTSLMALSQGSRIWGEWAEIATIVITGWWLWHEMPTDRHGRQFVLAIGSVIVMTLFYSLPMPWPRYSQALYFTRLYSTAGFFAVSVAMVLLPWADHEVPALRQVLAIPWFGAVLLAGSQRGWPRWPIALITNLIWTACLLAWLQWGRRKSARVRSMMVS